MTRDEVIAVLLLMGYQEDSQHGTAFFEHQTLPPAWVGGTSEVFIIPRDFSSKGEINIKYLHMYIGEFTQALTDAISGLGGDV